MTLQWVSAVAFLYTEMGLGLLLCFGFISNTRWQNLFNSRLLALVKQYGNFYFSAFVLILFLLFLDSIWNMQKYSRIDTSHADLRNNPQAEVQAHMKLFRAQRNSYISGFSLFMLIVIRRLVTLVSRQATLEASHEAMKKQATGANEQARKLMDENEKLRRANREQANSGSEVGDDEKSELIARLKAELKESKERSIEHEEKKLKAEKNLEALKAQSEGLHKEYDRLAEEHSRLSKKLSALTGTSEDKKEA